jgi:hypothetical protein
MKLSKSATNTLEMLREAFGEHSLNQTMVFEWHSWSKAGRVSVEDDERSGRPSTNKRTENVERIQELINEDCTEQSMSLQTLLGSVMEFVRRS